MGRAGRAGEPAVCVYIRKIGEKTPKEMKPFLKSGSITCLKKGLEAIFTLTDCDGKPKLSPVGLILRLMNIKEVC